MPTTTIAPVSRNAASQSTRASQEAGVQLGNLEIVASDDMGNRGVVPEERRTQTNRSARLSELEAELKKIAPPELAATYAATLNFIRQIDLASTALSSPAAPTAPTGMKSTSGASANPRGIAAASNGVIAANPGGIAAASNFATAANASEAAPSSTGAAQPYAALSASAALPSMPSSTAQSTQGRAWKGVSPAMWSEINAQKGAFGDATDSERRIKSIPSTGTVLYPEDVGNINAALRNSDIVVLKGGVYNITETIALNGKTLVGAEGETVIINGSQVRSLTPNDGLGVSIKMGDNSNLKNINLVNADNQGIVAGDNNNIYQVSVDSTGRNGGASTNGRGIIAGSNNVLVSVEVSNSYNYRTWDGKTSDGTNTAAGGNGDGILSGSNVLIDVHSHNNSDDGIDTWEGGRNYIYFSRSYENGKSDLGAPGGSMGDGNGFKLGRGSNTQFIYKSSAMGNKQSGFDQNGNTSSPVIVASQSANNGLSNYAQGAYLSNNAPALDLGASI
jgi:hypothetical protein